MPIAFDATLVSATKEDWGTLVAFGEDENLAEQRYLVLQGADSHSEQDVRLGMTDVYIETCDQRWSWYGHILSFELLRDRVKVQLDGRAAAEMGDTGEIEVTFDLSPERFGELRAALRRVFSDRDYFAEAPAP